MIINKLGGSNPDILLLIPLSIPLHSIFSNIFPWFNFPITLWISNIALENAPFVDDQNDDVRIVSILLVQSLQLLKLPQGILISFNIPIRSVSIFRVFYHAQVLHLL